MVDDPSDPWIGPEEKTARERIFLFFENGIFLTVLGVVGGLAGIFVNGHWFLLLVIPTLFGLHRSPALDDLKGRTKVYWYVVVAIVSAVGLWWIGLGVNSSREHIPSVQEIGEYLSGKIGKSSSVSSSKPSKIPVLPSPKLDSSSTPSPVPSGIRITKIDVPVFELGEKVVASVELKAFGDRSIRAIQRYATIAKPKPETDAGEKEQQAEVWDDYLRYRVRLKSSDTVYTIPPDLPLTLTMKSIPILDAITRDRVLEGRENFYIIGEFHDEKTHKPIKEFFFYKNSSGIVLCFDHN